MLPISIPTHRSSEGTDGHHTYVTVHPHQADMQHSAPPPPPEEAEQQKPEDDEIRTVKLEKEPGRSLGISIVGGKFIQGDF